MENLTRKKSKDNNIGESAFGGPTRSAFLFTCKVNGRFPLPIYRGLYEENTYSDFGYHPCHLDDK
jgi:hypothetical protein